ncbi:S-layer homology domain-containing protein [Tumebacillus sp. ITR2]|uniref:S-layer homology domain-containing protein n=1 Tax=Tumebacillus amylolyticus TaxID=2801339 RepID=A0ABS1JAV2_9BACL|nr:S-layer homology domain-containing protein [Tumebacillus amylolyticus]MBL0387414.1 S-layer homology domain-containing protein [Tumebacillus amylolyticus]
MKSIQRFLAVTLVLTATFSPSSLGATVQPSSEPSPWAQTPVRIVKGLQVMQGDPDGDFRPLEELTRQEFATVLSRVLELDTTGTSGSSFQDVSTADWGIRQIEAVRAAGLMMGDSSGHFYPNDNITREEIAVVLIRAARYNPVGAGMRLKTADQNKVSDWARDSVQAAIELGLMRGDGTHFFPQDTATREEVAVVALDLYRRTQEADTSVVEDLTGNTVQINGHTYQLSDRVKGLFQVGNAPLLVGSKVKFELSGNTISKVTYLDVRKGSGQFEAGNAFLDGDLILRGHDVQVNNLTLTGVLKAEGTGAQHVMLGHVTAAWGEVSQDGVQLEVSKDSQVSGLRLFADATISTGGAVLPQLVVEDGARNVRFDGSLGKVMFKSNESTELTGKGDVEQLTFDGTGKFTLNFDGKINVAEVDNLNAQCVLTSPDTIIEKLILNYGQTATGVVNNFPEAKGQILKIEYKGQTTDPNSNNGGNNGGGGGNVPNPPVPPTPPVNHVPVPKPNLDRIVVAGASPLLLAPSDVATDGDGDALAFSGAPGVSDPSKATLSVNAQGKLSIVPLQSGKVTISATVTDGKQTTGIVLHLDIKPSDQTPPVILGIADNQTYYNMVTPTSPDSDIQTVVLKRDGIAVNGYKLGTSLFQNGTYLLTVTDRAGNSTVMHFVLNIGMPAPDMTPPTVSGVADNQTYATAVTPTTGDSDIRSVVLTRDGAPVSGYALGTPISQNGTYVLKVTDFAMNTTTVRFVVNINTGGPAVTGVADQQVYSSAVIPVSSAADIQTVELTQNGVPVSGYTLNTPVTADGVYVLTVTNLAGNATVIHFTIDTVAPVVTGVTDNQNTSGAVTPVSTDTDIQTVVLTMDGTPVAGYALGTEINQPGAYVLTVTDVAGNSTVLHFLLDTLNPVLTGVSDNGIYSNAVTPNSTDTDIQTVILSKDGLDVVGYTLGTQLYQDGVYMLTVIDTTGHTTVVHFTIDTAAPVVIGLDDNQNYTSSVTPTSADTDIQNVSLTRNGATVDGYTLGTTIAQDGTYVLTVTDLAGNSKVLHFTLDTMPPVITGVADNQFYTSAVIPESTDSDIQTVTLTQDGTLVAGYTLGTPITQDGEYVLTVTDFSGFSTVVHFTLDTVSPVISGVSENGFYNTAVTPTCTDSDVQGVTLIQNGTMVAGYTLGTTLTSDGQYVLTVTDTAGNSTMVAFSIDTIAPVVTGVSDNQVSTSAVTPVSGDTDIQTVQLTKNGALVAGYTLGTPVTSDGTYVLTVTDRTGNSTVLHFSLDVTPPQVSGVLDNHAYKSAVTPTSADTDIQSVTLSMDGTIVAGYALGTPITQDGTYELTVSDVSGNITTIHFTVDTVAPILIGVADNQVSTTSVTPTSSDTDIQTVNLTKNGSSVAGYTLGSAITQDGTYVLTATDFAGNTTVVHFSIDATAPLVTGVLDNHIYTTGVTPDSGDSDIQTVVLTQDGSTVAGYILGTPISQDGTYVLTVTDFAGNTSQVHFSIDSVAPVVTGVSDNQAYTTVVTPISSDSDIQSVLLTNNGAPVAEYTLGSPISQDGSYVLTLTDFAGNTTVLHFSLDRTAPLLTGVLDNHYYTAGVIPSSNDGDIQSVELTRNGTDVAGYTLGSAITQDGTYMLKVTDLAGNARILHFTIDQVAPQVTGVLDSHLYNTAVLPSSIDSDIQTVTLTQNGTAVVGYTLGSTLTSDGMYVLTVTDFAGNSTVLHFQIDATAPVVTGVADNQLYASTVTPASADSDIQTVVLTQDGISVSGYTLGTPISQSGAYVLTVTDQAGNTSVMHFNIDTVAPVVSGVLDNHIYTSSLTPTSGDTDIQSVTLTRDGSAVVGYTLGTAITQDGAYVLTVTDLAGNSTVTHFTLDTTAPLVSGILDNHIYNTSVTPTSGDTDIQTVTLTKNGSAVAGYTLGNAITQDGTYVLTVVDQAGNSTVLHFALDSVAPTIAGVLDNHIYAGSVTPTSGDTDIQSITLTHDGTVVNGYSLGTTITQDGTYELTVIDQAGNSTVRHFTIDTLAPVIAWVTDNHLYNFGVTPTSPDTDIQSVQLTKNGTVVADYTLGAAITQNGSYVLTLTDFAGNTSVMHFAIDTTSPTVNGVLDNHFYQTAVTPTSSDGDIQTVALTQNGSPIAGYTLGTTITQDGAYVLTVTDQAGNDTVYHFNIDQTPPTIVDVIDNHLYNSTVTPNSADTDIQTVQLTKNGSTVGGYTLGTTLTEDGSYVLTVTDLSGNTTVCHFSIDMMAPTVSGVLNHHIYNTTVTPTNSDSDIQSVTLTKDGSTVAGYTFGTTLTQNGDYTLTVTDHAGNTVVLTFTIDTVAPNVAGVVENQLYNTTVTPTSADSDIQSVTLTQDGTGVAGYSLGTTLTQNGSYVLTVTDVAGNTTVRHFSIDMAAPLVTGVLDNQLYNTAVTPTSLDTDIQSTTLTKNGVATPYSMGSAISQDGTYVLTVTDLAGNSTVLHFSVDSSAPVVTGVADNQMYVASVTPNSADTDIQTVTLTKQGTPVSGYALGTLITEDGTYVLTVTDFAGNSTTLHFSVDTVAPTISGAVDNHLYNTSVTPTTSDTDIQTVTLTQNGFTVPGYMLGGTLTQDGNYVLTVTDQAGNTTVRHFGIDTTAPVVTGVIENQLYNTTVTPTSADTDIQTVTLTRNGLSVPGYTLGSAIPLDGAYVLTVTDLAGNITQTQFNIDKSAPVVTGLVENHLYNTSVIPSSADTDIQSVLLTKNGSAVVGYTLGTAINQDGSYELTVTDFAGNATVYHFSLDTTAPTVSGVLNTHIYNTTVTPASVDTDIQTVTLTRNGSAVAGYTLGTTLTLDGAYVLTVTDLAGNTTALNFTVDTTAPTVTGVIDNHLYNTTVTPSSADTDIQTVTLTKDGSAVAGYTLGTTLSQNGSYVLTLIDQAGNTTVRHFSIDTTAPVLSGLIDNHLYNTSVTPASTDIDIQSVTLTKNGSTVAGYNLGTAITQDGTYVLTVTDQSGNATVYHFGIDQVAPVISGLIDNHLYNTSVNPTSADTDIQTVQLTKNGSTVAGYTLGDPIVQNGTYVLTVTDLSGNTTVFHFTLDVTAPVIAGITDNQTYTNSLTPTSSDTDIQTVALTRNGSTVGGYALGTSLTQNGTYVLSVSDVAGNVTTLHFTINDTTAPSVSGVLDNKSYNTAVTPTSGDVDIQSVTLTQNGSTVAGYTLGTAITQAGVYALTLSDLNGNTSVTHFTLDMTAPVVSGVSDNQTYTAAVTPTSSDSDIGTVALTRNGTAVVGYTLGTAIMRNGTYVLTVTDVAGNATVVHFTMNDTTPPVISGVTEGQNSTTPLTPTSTSNDIQTVTLTRYGTTVNGYTLGTAIGYGSYTLTVTDVNGNSTVVHFNIKQSFEETDASVLTYNGTWSFTGNTSNNGGNAKFSSTAGASYTITFSGTFIQIFGYKASNCGIVDIYVDGVKQSTFDLYANPNQYKVQVYYNNALPAGTHTVQVVSTGTKNASSSNTIINLDYFTIQ